MTGTGKVTFVGAGPGRPELVTVRGRAVLEQADVVLYDYLADPRVLEAVSPSAERICLGKHGTGRIWSQEQIVDAMVASARAGRHVVRLKGGDPALFGRLGEELQALRRHRIPFEIVPGVTAALGAAAYAGVSLTHRDWASAVALVTGQRAASETDQLLTDFESLARFPGTLVVYMGVTTVRIWTGGLLRGGKPPDCPVLAVRRATWPDQTSHRCRLSDLADWVETSRLRPPVVFVVGEAATPCTSWFEQLPLFGKTVLITRPAHQAASLAQRLEERGATTRVHATVEMHPPAAWDAVDQAIGRLPTFDWVVFSSANGVDQFLARMREQGRDARAFGNARIAAIGPATACALERWMLKADLVPETYRSETLADALACQARGARFLLVRAERGRRHLAERLTAAGAIVESVVAYRMVDVTTADPEITHGLEAGNIDWVTVTSSAIARALAKLWGDRLRHTRLVSISPVTSATIRELGYDVAAEAEVATMDGLVDAIVRAES